MYTWNPIQVDWSGIDISNRESCVSHYLAFLGIFRSVCKWTDSLVSRPGHYAFLWGTNKLLIDHGFWLLDNI